MTEIIIPKAFKCLWDEKRYKILYGGRGGAKSHNIGRYLLIKGMAKKSRILCTREIQGSIRDSVHKLLSDIIGMYPALTDFYTVQRDNIYGKNGTEFLFKGLKHNSTEIKSTEGIDIAWVEEAERVSDASWEVLIPTIRKEGSQILISFNPKQPTDPTYVRFVANADESMTVKKVSYLDNPFFPKVLDAERLRLQKNDPEAYKHIWEGEFDTRFTGSVYADLLDKAKAEGRISRVPYDPSVPVITAWDIGFADYTVIWFAQVVGKEPRIIDYYINNFEDLDHYVKEINSKPYNYEQHYLPHDAQHERLGMAQSISGQLRKMGLNHVVLKVKNVDAGIQLGRQLLQSVWIDQDKCRDGLHELRQYQYEYDEAKQMFKKSPTHNDPADAFRYLATALEQRKTRNQPNTKRKARARRGSSTSWMA